VIALCVASAATIGAIAASYCALAAVAQHVESLDAERAHESASSPPPPATSVGIRCAKVRSLG
jgi:hypothetical protein